MATFLGMRGTGDWVENQRPENWREMILRLYPNGSAPLTAVLSMMRKEKTDDPVFHWWTKVLPNQAGAVSGVYTDAAMGNAYAGGGEAGDTLYIKTNEDGVQHFRPGHTAVLACTTDSRMTVFCRVAAVEANGDNSKITVVLQEDDDNSPSANLSDANRIAVVGSANPEGGDIPQALAYNPVELSNQTQIFRTSLDMTRTAMKTRLRTGDAYKEAKREALELHSIEMEKAYIWGVRRTETGANGKPQRYTWGIVPFVREYAPSNIIDYRFDTEFNGKTWEQGGEAFMDKIAELAFRYDGDDVLALCGSAALASVNKIAKSSGTIQLTPRTAAYGLKVVEWISPSGTIYFKTHPLFSIEPAWQHMVILLRPKYLRFRYIDDTKFLPNRQSPSIDGRTDEFLTEAGLEFHHPQTFLVVNGVGLDNEQA